MSAHWSVVLPWRGGSRSKSRLAVGLGSSGAARLAAAMAIDVATVATCSPLVSDVILLTQTPSAASLLANLPADVAVVNDDATHAADPLNASIEAWLSTRGPDQPVAVLLPDVPALTVDSLGRALAAADQQAPRSLFIPDASGSGTVLLAGLAGRLTPCFGERSARRHDEAGAMRFDPHDPRLQTDVDTVADLARVVALGAGPQTTTVLERSGTFGDAD